MYVIRKGLQIKIVLDILCVINLQNQQFLLTASFVIDDVIQKEEKYFSPMEVVLYISLIRQIPH